MSVRGLGLVFVGYGLLVMPACIFGNGGSDTDTPEGTDVDGTDVDGTDGEGSDVTGNEPPRILDYSVDTFTATDDEQLRFTAVVTDPDGIDDVIGGTMKSPDGASYGAFQTSAAEGSYQFSLTWNDINTVDTIYLDDSDERTFVAEFFDASGATVSDEITVTLECAGFNEGTCGDNGQCSQMDRRQNCGECGNDCADLAPSISPADGYVNAPVYCFANGEQCGIRFGISGGTGLSCSDVCGSWTCTEALDFRTPIGCGETSSGDILCRCARSN